MKASTEGLDDIDDLNATQRALEATLTCAWTRDFTWIPQLVLPLRPVQVHDTKVHDTYLKLRA